MPARGRSQGQLLMVVPVSTPSIAMRLRGTMSCGPTRRSLLQSRQQVARAVNSALTLLYWRVGDRIRRQILNEQRAGYGERIVLALGSRLESEFGRGFSEKSLRHMIRFAESFPDTRIVSALLRQLSWTHFLSIESMWPHI